MCVLCCSNVLRKLNDLMRSRLVATNVSDVMSGSTARCSLLTNCSAAVTLKARFVYTDVRLDLESGLGLGFALGFG
jgi:hypothetical protein